MNISDRLKKIAPSPTLVISQKAAEMKAGGTDVISFGAGEPDFTTPTFVSDAAKQALDDGLTHYAPVAGIPEFRNAIAENILKSTGAKYEADQIIATCGAKAAIFIALQAILNPGDEVIVPAPYWVSYPAQVQLAGGEMVTVETKEENKFKMTTDEFRNAVTNKTRAVIFNSPSNPTGSLYTKNELNDLIEICLEKDIIIIADEIYDKLVYDGEFTSVISANPNAVKNTIYINGLSKSYAMTGWRVGWAAGPKDVIKAMCKYQGQLYTSITTFVQKASAVALNTKTEEIDKMVATFKERRDLMVGLIEGIPGVSCVKPDGAFYAYINVKNYFNGDSAKLAEHLLDNAHVAVVPGSAFGMDGYIRLSFATSDENIVEGLKRIKSYLERI